MPKTQKTRTHRKRSDDSKPSARKGGRKSALTEEVKNAIVEGLKAGNYLTTICDSLGLPYSTVNYWRWRGRPQPVFDDDGHQIGEAYPNDFYGDFVRECHQAESFAEMEAVKSLSGHFDKDWRAAAEFLSRKYPQKWNPKTVVEMSGKDGGPIQIENSRESLYAQLDVIRDKDPEALSPGPEALDPGSEVEDAEIVEDEPEGQQLALPI